MLVREVEKKKEILYGKFSNKISAATKDSAWADVATKVSAVGTPRTVTELKDKKSKWFSDVKAKVCKREIKHMISSIIYNVYGLKSNQATCSLMGSSPSDRGSRESTYN